MPQISAFYGIVIAMYFNDHVPPHFHAIYAGDEATINIETGEVTVSYPGGRCGSFESGPQPTAKSCR